MERGLTHPFWHPGRRSGAFGRDQRREPGWWEGREQESRPSLGPVRRHGSAGVVSRPSTTPTRGGGNVRWRNAYSPPQPRKVTAARRGIDAEALLVWGIRTAIRALINF